MGMVCCTCRRLAACVDRQRHPKLDKNRFRLSVKVVFTSWTAPRT